MDQSPLRKPLYSKLLALYDNYDVSRDIILFFLQYKRIDVVLVRWTHQGEKLFPKVSCVRRTTS